MSDKYLLDKLQNYGTRQSKQDSELLGSSLDYSHKASSSPRFKSKLSPFRQSPVLHQSPQNQSNSIDFHTYDTNHEEVHKQDPQSEIRFLLKIIDQLQVDLQISQEESAILRNKYEQLYQTAERQSHTVLFDQIQHESKQHIDKLEKANKLQQLDLNASRKSNAEMQAKWIQAQKELDNLKLNASELLIQNEGLYSLLSSLKDKHQFELQSQQQHLELMNQKRLDEELTAVQKLLKREIDTLNSVSDQYKKKTEDLTHDCEQKGKKVQELSDCKLKQELEISLLSAKVARFVNLEKDMANLDALYQQKCRQCTQLAQENSTVVEEQKRLTLLLDKSQQSLKNQAAIFDQERSELTQRILTLQEKQDEVNSVNNEYKKSEMDQHKVMRQMQELGQENIRLLEQNTYILDKTNDTESLRVNYKQLVKKYTHLKSDYENLIQQLHHYATSAQILSHQLNSQTTEKNQVITNLHHTQQQLLNLSKNWNCTIDAQYARHY